MKRQIMDQRLEYSKMPCWQHGAQQSLQGVDIFTIQPYTKSNTMYEFHLPHHEILLFGPMSGFMVQGVFEVKESIAAADSTFKKVEEDGGSEMALQPNWFEHLIKDIQVCIGGSVINIHDVPKQADPFLNTYLNAHMFDEIKDLLFPEPENPGRCVGLSAEDWSLGNENSVWRKYSKEIFGKESFAFRYIPPFLFPFHQHPNFYAAGKLPSAVPMSIFGGQGKIFFELKDKLDGIFMKPATNTKEYRFRIESIKLVVEEARVNPTTLKMLSNPRQNLIFEGMCRIGKTETIPPAIMNYYCQFDHVPMPEGLFVFALPQMALTDDYACSTVDSKVFAEHNIQSVSVSFESKPLSMRTPKVGDFRDHTMVIKQVLDHLKYPPFGVFQQPGSSSFKTIRDGGDGTIFPHIYINLTPSGNETRTIPVGEDGQIVTKKGDLSLNFRFKSGGASNSVTYLIYLFYTDANLLYDVKKRKFTNVYSACRDE